MILTCVGALAEAASLRPEHFSCTPSRSGSRDIASLAAKLQHRDAGQRYVAAWHLARSDCPEAAELLAPALRDKCAMVRAEAILGVTQCDPGALARIEEALTADRALPVRAAIETARHRASGAGRDQSP